jgi:hypothetical protein
VSGNSTTTTNSTQSMQYAPWVTSAGQNLYGELSSQYPNWNGYSGPTSAAATQPQTVATDYASGAIGTNNSQLTGAGNTLQSVINSINPTAGPGQYMNPYVQQTLQPTLANLATANNQSNAGVAANATMNGQYGGTAQGVLQALNNNYYQQNVAGASGQAYSNAYNSAIQQQQNSLNTLLGAAAGQTGVGASENSNNNMLATLLGSIGGQEQNINQSGIQNGINLNTQNQEMPLTQGTQLAALLSSLPQNYTSYGTQQTTQPNNIGYALLGSVLAGL